MTEKVSIKISDVKERKIMNQIKKELEGIKNELKKSNASRDKRYKEWTKIKKNGKKLIVSNLIMRHHVFDILFGLS